jgi:hypothetical protein
VTRSCGKLRESRYKDKVEGARVNTDFEEMNAYVYHSVRGVMLDVVIWCLGPYVDATRAYGLPRIYLARATRVVVRRCCSIRATEFTE